MTTVEIGGHSVEVQITSGNDPTVVLVSSMGAPGTEWRSVTQSLTTRPRLVTYDRPGVGASPARPAPNPPLPYSTFAAELITMLQRLDLVESVVAVGHSFGSLIVRMFAACSPHLVAAMVHVDGSVPSLSLWPGSTDFLDGFGPTATGIDATAGAAELASAVLPCVPAIVVVRTPGRWEIPPPSPDIDPLWQDSQAVLARQTAAQLVVATDSGHRMPREAPALVAYAIDAVVHAVRDRAGTVRLDPDGLATAGGRLVATGSADRVR